MKITERNQQRVIHAFHGTSTEFLDQIKAHGLTPNPPAKAYAGSHQSPNISALASMDGIYLTDNKATAREYAKHAVTQFGGKPMIVIVQYTKNSTLVDEDDIYAWVTDQFVSTMGEGGKKAFYGWDDPTKGDVFYAIQSNDKSMQRLMPNDFRSTFRVSRDADLHPVWELLQLVASVVDEENIEPADLLGWVKVMYNYQDEWNHMRELIATIIGIVDRPETPPSPFKTNSFRIDRTIGYRGKSRILAIVDGNKTSRWVAYGTPPKKYVTEQSGLQKFNTLMEAYYATDDWILVERAMAGAAIKDTKTGKIYGPDYTHHDVRVGDDMMDDFSEDHMWDGQFFDNDAFLEMLWDHMETGRLLDGFISNDGQFFTRKEAAKAIKLDPTQGDPSAGRDPSRDWLDSHDLDHVDPTIHEDVESDVENSKFLINLTNAFQAQLRKHLDSPIYNSDNMFVKMNGQRMVKFRGAQFNWPGAFRDVWVLLRNVGTKPEAGFHAYVHPDGHKERMVTFAVLPLEEEGTYDSDRMDVALSRMVSSEWGGIMLHELQHVVQDIRDIPMDGKGTFGKGDPSTTDYYNAPVEFDAYYHQLTRGYHALLLTLRNDPQAGAAMVREIGFDRDFRGSLDTMLPKNFDAPEFGMWYYARQKQNRRLTKRLYALHQAIVKEIDNMGLTEEDINHQAALDTTGYWGNAGAGCLIMAQDTRRILIPKRSQWVQEPGTWGTWGGAIDEGENPQDACLREVQEEAGYTGRVLNMTHLYRFQDKDFRYDTFLATVETEFDPQLNWETEQAEWFEIGDWPSPLHFGLVEVLKDSSVLNKLGMAASS